jgi:hypothetical protein
MFHGEISEWWMSDALHHTKRQPPPKSGGNGELVLATKRQALLFT